MKENQLITLAVLVLCIVICYRSASSVLSMVLGALIVMHFIKQGIIDTDLYSYLPRKMMVFEPEINIKKTKAKDSFIDNNVTIDNGLIKQIEQQIIKQTDIELKKDEYNILPKYNDKLDTFESYSGNIDIKTENKVLNNNFIDGDEKMAYHNKVRNEPTRVIIGSTQAYKKLNKYVQEEIDEQETREWWGHNDY